MRTIAIFVVTLSMIGLAATLRWAPMATAESSKAANAQVDPYALQQKMGLKSLSDQAVTDLF